MRATGYEMIGSMDVEPNETMLNAAKLRAVFVDDLPDMLQCLTECMQDSGVIDVIGTACNGAEALQVATALKPDLVLMDVNMPVMDGLAAAREIKKAAPGTQVILMSADDSPVTREMALQAGANEFISKKKLLLCAPLLLKMLAA